MTEAMPFLQKAILLSYDPWPFAGELFFCLTNVRFRTIIPLDCTISY